MVGRSVCLSVCLSVTFVSPAETAEAIEMLFSRRTQVGTRNHVLDGSPIPQRDWAIFGVCFSIPLKSIVSLCFSVCKNG